MNSFLQYSKIHYFITSYMPRSGKPHPRKEIESICCSNAHLKKMNQFVAPMNITICINSTSYLNPLKYYLKALWALLGVTTPT